MIQTKSGWQIFLENKEKWNSFVVKSEGQFRQLFEWGEFKKKLGWDVLRVAFYENDEFVCSTQILLRKKLFLSYIYIPGGINGDLNKLDINFINFIKKETNSFFLYFRFDFVQDHSEKFIQNFKKMKLTRPSYIMHNGKFFILNLSKNNEELLKLAKQKWRYHHKRSQKKDNNFFVEKNSDHFIDNEKELSKLRNHRNLYNKREVTPLIEELGEKLVVCVSKDSNGNLLALRSVVLLGDTAWHLNSSVNSKGRNYLSGYSLLMKTIETCREKGIKNYNLGGINIDRFPGPYKFKMGIAGEKNLKNTLGEWEYSNPFFLKIFFNYGIKLYFHSSYILSKIFKNL